MQSGKSPEKSASKKKTATGRSVKGSGEKKALKSASDRSTAKKSSTLKEEPLKKAGATETRSKVSSFSKTSVKQQKKKATVPSWETGSKWSTASFSPAAYEKRQSQMAPRYYFNDNLPQSYHESYFRAMARDPEWVFAYWEIDPKQIQDLKSRLGEETFNSSKRVIRILDITDVSYDGTNALSSTDIEINGFANNWYLKVPQSGKAYLLEIGFLVPHGEFTVLMRSNPISVPAAEPSTQTSGEWGTVETDELLRLSGLGKIQIGASESIALQHLERKAKYSAPYSLEQIGASENVLFWGASEHVSSDSMVNR